MLKMKQDNDDPSSSSQQPRIIANDEGADAGQPPIKDKKQNGGGGLLGWLRTMFKPKQENTLREALEEYIDEANGEEEAYDSTSIQERAILGNILKLRDIKVIDVMIPRADIVAIDEGISQDNLLNLLNERQFSRLPVYRENLDDVLGTVHIKDVLSALSQKKKINISEMITEIPIVSPSMHVLDLILEMRQNRRHMALVVDEYGGIDGLVTIGDVIEAIVGDLHDEHDNNKEPQISQNDDGSVTADARVDIDDFEALYGTVFSDEEREESDTLGGIVCYIAGRVPDRGEILTHDNGTTFEVLDADPRRVSLLKIRNIPEGALS